MYRSFFLHRGVGVASLTMTMLESQASAGIPREAWTPTIWNGWPHGSLVLLGTTTPVPPPHLAGLRPEELAYAATLEQPRRDQWLAGRITLAHALALVANDDPTARPSLLSAPDQALRLPLGVVGSLSHKGRLMAALLAPDVGQSLGVDIERVSTTDVHLAGRILHANERRAFADVPSAKRAGAVTAYFSVKEAVWKALGLATQATTEHDAIDVGDACIDLSPNIREFPVRLHDRPVPGLRACVRRRGSCILSSAWRVASADHLPTPRPETLLPAPRAAQRGR